MASKAWTAFKGLLIVAVVMAGTVAVTELAKRNSPGIRIVIGNVVVGPDIQA